VKNFIRWFKNSKGVKRWIVLLFISMILICYGFSKVMSTEEVGNILELIEIVITFALGFVGFVAGIIFIQRKTIEVTLTSTKDNEEMSDVKATNSIYDKGPKVVVIGGGSGINNVLEGLKKYTTNITAIATVSSYGNEKTFSKKELKLRPMEDVQENMIALCPSSEKMNQLMKYKFTEGKLKNLSFGDIFLSAMENVYEDSGKSIEKSSEILNMVGKVIPVTLDEMNICAELQDGTIVEQKNKIAEIVSDKVTRINRVYINPTNCRPTEGIIDAIKEADAIVIGPGSLYTNVIPNLLIRGVSKAIKDSKALKIYISNVMTEPGQTDDYEVSDHIKAIQEHAGENIIDFCIADTGEIIPEYVRKYNLAGSTLVNPDTKNVKGMGVIVYESNVSTLKDEHIIHNPDNIARAIIEIICTDFKVKDQQSDESYLLLNSKLKEEEKKEQANKEKKVKEPKKVKEKGARKESKFTTKYKERIKSIQESELSRQTNLKVHKKAEKMISEEEKKQKEEFLKETYEKTVKK